MPYSPTQLDLFAISDPRKQYINIAELYYQPWDPLVELIQNGIAGIQDAISAGLVKTGEIRVVVDGVKKELSVTDNGSGFASLDVVGAGCTTRDINKSTPQAGFGIGLTSVIARSDYAEIKSVNAKSEEHYAVWDSTRSKLYSSAAILKLMPSKCTGPRPTTHKPLTTLTFRGDDGFAELWKRASHEPEQLIEIIKCHTAIGHTSHIWGTPTKHLRPNIRFKISIVSPLKTFSENGQIGLSVVQPNDPKAFNFDDYSKHGHIPDPDKLIVYKYAGRSTATKPAAFSIYMACEVERGNLIRSMFGAYLDDLITNRILLSINGFPQSFPVDRPAERRTRSLWANIIAVVDSSHNIVEPGRNRISDQYAKEVHEALKRAINKLDELATKVRDKEKYSRGIDVDEAKKKAIHDATDKPLTYNVGNDIHLLKKPDNETEVVALFYDLLGAGRVAGVKALCQGTTQDTYDAYLFMTFTWGDVGEKRRPKKDEGSRKLDLAKTREKVLATEFKLNGADLATELSSGRTNKKRTQIDLLVCWEEGSIPAEYTLQSIDDDERFFPAASHRMKHSATKHEIEVVVLRSFLERLEEDYDASLLSGSAP